ncbi:GNAT family N-acetyltransferase [Deinococcus lacus]|uniref:GNAT family N-acetyltransferase n=1 Tax=Deinococcus lacus TaxID=392561 RepID=A0ABW1Y9X7_9DEIO
MSGSPTIRLAQPGDAQRIAAHRYPDLPEASEAAQLYAAWLPGAMGRGIYLGWLTERDGEVVAGAGLTLLEWGPTKDDPQPWRGRVVNVWTHPAHRRRGLAHQLVGAALAEAEARGIHTVSLGATEMSRPLYEALGFRSYGAEMLRR